MSTAGRIFPTRAAARDVLIAELARLIDRAFATTLPEEVTRSAVKHDVIERVTRELVASGALDRAVSDALASQKTTELTERIVHSDQMRLAIREIVESREVRDALARQTTGLAQELVGSVRARAVALDGRFARERMSAFAGIASRAVAFAIDAAAVFLIFVSLSAMIALISTLVGTLRPAWLVGLLLGSGLALIGGTYFVVFWTAAGQTPGMRLIRLRLLGPGGRPPSLARALVRAVGTVISIVPLFAGYLPVLFDERRRGLPDLLAGTVVVYEDGPAN